MGMDENRNQSPESFQFSLRTLLLMVTACAALFSGLRMGYLAGGLALGLFCSIIVIIVVARSRHENFVDAMLLVYVVAMLFFLVSIFVVGM